MTFLFAVVPSVGFLVFSTKAIGLVPAEFYQRWFFSADWTRFAGLAGAHSWICAGRECFFTWGFMAVVVLQLASHNRFENVGFFFFLLITISLIFGHFCASHYFSVYSGHNSCQILYFALWY